MKTTLATLGALLTALMLVSAASAATETPFSATAQFTQIIPGTVWFADGVFQSRDQVSIATVSGDLVGTRVGNINRAGDRIWGSFVLTTATVTYEARLQGTIESNCVHISFVGQGSDGSIIRG